MIGIPYEPTDDATVAVEQGLGLRTVLRWIGSEPQSADIRGTLQSFHQSRVTRETLGRHFLKRGNRSLSGLSMSQVEFEVCLRGQPPRVKRADEGRRKDHQCQSC